MNLHHHGEGKVCSDGMPQVIQIDRKPKGVGCELKNKEGSDVMSCKE